MQSIRQIIEINEDLCDGCGLCVPDCAEGSLKIIDGKAKLVADNLCDGLGACMGACPTGALKIVERQADDFDEEAVEHYLANEKKNQPRGDQNKMECGCSSAEITMATMGNSALTHWPVQIRLIPPQAPFLQGADLLVAADCTAIASKNFQEKYLQGKTVMIGCPKFDDAASYVERFTEIINNCNLKSLTVLIMEVPCCSAMNVIVQQAIKNSGKTVPLKQITITTGGEELDGQNTISLRPHL